MRTIKQSSQFKRDLKREAKGSHRQALQSDFVAIISILANDQALTEKHRDHALTGDWKDHRDCHVKPDLVLIYRKPDDTVNPPTVNKRGCSRAGASLQCMHVMAKQEDKMANLSIRKLDDDTITRLRIRAAHHRISMEEEARRILRQAVTPPKRLGDLSVQFFGTESGVELELPQHAPHDPLSFA